MFCKIGVLKIHKIYWKTPVFCEIFKITIFHRTPTVAASDKGSEIRQKQISNFFGFKQYRLIFLLFAKHFIQDCTRPAKRFHDKFLKNDQSAFKLNSFSKFIEKNNENVMKIIFKTSDVIIISDRHIRTKIASSIYQLPSLQMTYDVGKKFIFIFFTRYRNTLRVPGNEKKTNITKYF